LLVRQSEQSANFGSITQDEIGIRWSQRATAPFQKSLARKSGELQMNCGNIEPTLFNRDSARSANSGLHNDRIPDDVDANDQLSGVDRSLHLPGFRLSFND
jgi:hypothetical protein